MGDGLEGCTSRKDSGRRGNDVSSWVFICCEFSEIAWKLQITKHPGGIMALQEPKSSAQKLIGDIAPKLVDLTEQVLFGDVWERPGLCKRDRSLITVATLVALNRTEQLRGHLERALKNGVTKDEIVELITHLAFYSGWPTAMSAMMLAKDVFGLNK
jgi:4-carboxymuconolactone decarboxylase